MDLLQLVRGCTFDDFLFSPQCGVLPRRDPDAVDLSTRFSEHVVVPELFRIVIQKFSRASRRRSL
jgi:hypothetical protein